MSKLKSILFLLVISLLSSDIICQPTSALSGVVTDATFDAGCNNGSVNLQINGSYPPYEVAWYNTNGNILVKYINGVPGNDGQEDVTGLQPGSYQVVVGDALCRSASATFKVACVCVHNYTYTIDINSLTPIQAGGGCNGMVDISVNGIVGQLNYEWTGPNGFLVYTEDLVDLCNPGEYTLKVTFPDGFCYTTFSVLVVKCNPAFQPLQTITKECPGESNGSILINPSPGSIAPYTYSWSNGATTKDLDEIGSGEYCLTITDGNGCESKPECYNVGSFDPLTTIDLDLYPVSPICTGVGSINVNFPALGFHKTPYTFMWSTGETTPFNISVNQPDYYSVSVTDGCGNVASIGEYYGVYRPLEVELLLSNDCSLPLDIIPSIYGGGTGPYTYIWNTGATTDLLSVTQGGTYTVTVTSSQGCSGINSILAPVVQNKNVTGITSNPTYSCSYNGSIYLNIHTTGHF